MAAKHTPGIFVQHDGDTWRIIGEGATRDGKTFCHLASTTRGRMQRNGWNPVQISDWIDNAVILSSAIKSEEAQRAITAYYTDRNNSGLAALAK